MRLGPATLVALAVLSVQPDFTHLSLSPRSAEASTSVELSVADLVSKSTLVVAGTPLDRQSLWEETDGARGRHIVSYTRVRVDRVVDGQADGEVWVRTLGGIVGDIGQHVDGEAILVPETPALLFLHRLSDGTHAVVGMSQGNYPLEAPAQAGAPMRVLVPRALGRLVPRAGVPTPERQPARLVLPGKTLEDAAQLIVVTRRNNGP